MRYPDKTAWRRELEKASVLPEGFASAVTSLQFIPREKPDAGTQSMNLALLRLDKPSPSFAGMFTRNAFPGWPVVAGRRLLDEGAVQGVLVNNKVANVGVSGGLEDSLNLTGETARIFGDSHAYLPLSTGVIGWRLPAAEMKEAAEKLPGLLQRESLLPFAECIMTTDSWPKVRSASCGAGRITGAAKGAGMVEPDMATMLAFFLTDVDVPRNSARRILSEAVNMSFNRMSVDGETSTSDSVILLSSGVHPYPGDSAFRNSLMETAALLAEDVVRNGEGCSHVFRVTVSGAPDEKTAVTLARCVANAPLTKTAVRGNDPNVGRVLQALGAACGRIGLELQRNRLTMDIGNCRVFEKGDFLLDGGTEGRLAGYFAEREMPLPSPGWPLHNERVEMELSLGLGRCRASVTGSDLSEDYIRINADYRT
ncbi:MAG: arginine biosynthesis protein ArgJ [Spirochaetales bacterium]|nr:MAG: arginine biosynthesis protein ArgJ [Spirochaetales bacterium]